MILFKFPSRQRPHYCFRAIESIEKTIDTSDYEILLSLDISDTSMHNEFVINKLKEHKNVTIDWDESPTKIHAINRNIHKAKTDWKILICMSDDFIFWQQGWDILLRDETAKHFANDYFAHFNDGFQRSKVSTMSIMDREYYNRFGYIYHPSYKSLWCDNEATEVAKTLGRHFYSDYVIAQHLHPATCGIDQDDLYKRNELYAKIDHANYLSRKELNFPI